MRHRRALAAAALLTALPLAAPAVTRAQRAGDALPLVALAPGVWLAPGDTGRGVEGRPNAGFVVGDSAVLVIDALATPRQGARLLAAIRSVTPKPVRWLALTHHHPDHHFGAVALVRAGARVVAHPDRRTLAAESGEEALEAEWTRAMGEKEMRGFALADSPAVAVTRDTAIMLGGRRVELLATPGAHTPGDLMVWLPDARVLFAGDVLVEDGLTMLVDGSSAALLAALARIDSLGARVAVPGHGRVAAPPDPLVMRTRCALLRSRAAMRSAAEAGTPLSRVLAALPPADADRPLSPASRARRNAVRIHQELEHELMSSAPPIPADPRCAP